MCYATAFVVLMGGTLGRNTEDAGNRFDAALGFHRLFSRDRLKNGFSILSGNVPRLLLEVRRAKTATKEAVS